MDEEDEAADEREVLADATFPVYAAEGLPLELSGWGGHDGEPVTSVSLGHHLDDDRWAEVESEVAKHGFHLPDAERDAVTMLSWVGDAPAVVAAGGRPLHVDGVDLTFAFARAAEHWVAIGPVGEVIVTVRAFGIEPRELRLRALADPTKALGAEAPEFRAGRPQREVLDPRRVADLADSTPIEDLGSTLAGFARGALALLVSEETGPSWIGGGPELPADMPWPEGAHGPMAFVAQLSLADLDPSVWTGPTAGHLHIFCDIEPESGSIEGPGACTILHTRAESERTARRITSGLHEDNRIRRQTVTPRVGLTIPDADAPIMLPLGLGFGGERERDADALWKLNERLAVEQGWHRPAGRLLGWPTWQNDDNMAYLASLRGVKDLDWTLLLQTDAFGPELYVVLPTADLAAGRFERAEATIEHD